MQQPRAPLLHYRESIPKGRIMPAISKNMNATKSRNEHPDHRELLPKLNRAEGQILGIKRMIEERRYCTEIIQQLRATRNALASIEGSLLETHLRQCVVDALKSKKTKRVNEKISEIMRLFKSGEANGLDLRPHGEFEIRKK